MKTSTSYHLKVEIFSSLILIISLLAFSTRPSLGVSINIDYDQSQASSNSPASRTPVGSLDFLDIAQSNPQGSHSESASTPFKALSVQQGATLIETFPSSPSTPSPSLFQSFAQDESSILGRVTLGPGSVISPGNSPGIQRYNGGLTMQGGVVYEVDLDILDSVAGIGWDLIDVRGQLTINASADNPILIRLLSATWLSDFNANTDYIGNWMIATATGQISGFNPSFFRIDTSGFNANLGNGYFYLSSDSNNLHLNFARSTIMVPEPSRVILLMSGILFLLKRKRF